MYSVQVNLCVFYVVPIDQHASCEPFLARERNVHYSVSSSTRNACGGCRSFLGRHMDVGCCGKKVVRTRLFYVSVL